MTDPLTPQSEAISADYPFATKTLEVRGARMSYIDEGEGDPILFLHGNGTWSYLWRNVIPHLRGQGRLIAPDLIGMGRSDKPQLSYGFFDHAGYLEDFIAALGLEGIILVVHNWGSGLGFHYAARHPANVKALAFMEALVKPWDGWNTFPARFREQFKLFRDPAIGWDLIVGQNAFIEKAVPASQFRPLTSAELDAYHMPFRTEADRLPTWRWPNEIPIGGAPADVHNAWTAWTHWLQQSQTPKLLLKAEPGAIIDQPTFDWCVAHLPNLETADIGPGIHYVQEDNPHGVGRAVSAFVRRVQGRA